MVSALPSRLRCPDSTLAEDIMLCSWARFYGAMNNNNNKVYLNCKINLPVLLIKQEMPLSAQVCKWYRQILWWGNPAWDLHSIQGE